MHNARPFEIALVGIALVAAIFLFVRAGLLFEAVPTEYRSASPGFNWGWEYDYAGATQNAERFGEASWPWPAKQTGRRLLMPLNQPLVNETMTITYKGMRGSDAFELEVVIHRLDADVGYPQQFDVETAKKGIALADRRYVLEKITPRYLRLSQLQPTGIGG